MIKADLIKVQIHPSVPIVSIDASDLSTTRVPPVWASSSLLAVFRLGSIFASSAIEIF